MKTSLYTNIRLLLNIQMILNPETDRRNWTLLNFNFLCCLGYDCFHIMMSSSPNPVVSFNGKNTNHYMATKTSYIHHQISNLPGNPTKNDHFGVFWGYHHLRKHPYFLQVFCYQETRRSDRRPWGHPPKKKNHHSQIRLTHWDERPTVYFTVTNLGPRLSQNPGFGR